jgi:hypothetical protein
VKRVEDWRKRRTVDKVKRKGKLNLFAFDCLHKWSGTRVADITKQEHEIKVVLLVKLLNFRDKLLNSSVAIC